MSSEKRVVHILDDLALGGVTRALKNFEHPILTNIATHDVVDIRNTSVHAQSPSDIAIIHFTANWKKLNWLAKLKLMGGFDRVILIEHSYTEGYEASEVAPKRRFRLMLKLAYRLVDTVVAVSNAQREWILEHNLATPEKVIAIPQSRNCIELFEMQPCERLEGPVQIRAFGRFHKQKGFDLLIEAMARVPAQIAHLKIAGTGPDEAQLKALAKNLPHVEICDAFETPSEFLSDADIVAIPSRWEAFGLVGTEARAAGRPILASRVDGLRDQLDENGFGHAPNCVASIVRAIFRSAQTENLAARGRATQMRAATEFEQMVKQWQTLLIEA